MEQDNQNDYPETYPETRPLTFQYELAVLNEECGEVGQIVGKALRFGWDSYSPLDPERRTNYDLLHDELGDVMGAIDFSVERGLLNREKLVTRQFEKRKRLHALAPEAVYPQEGEFAPKVVVATPHPAMTIGAIIFGIVLLMACFYVGRISAQTAVPASSEATTPAPSSSPTPAPTPTAAVKHSSLDEPIPTDPTAQHHRKRKATASASSANEK